MRGVINQPFLAIGGLAALLLLGVGCVQPLGPDVTFELHDLDRPAMLSRVDLIAGDGVPPHEHTFIADVDHSCSYEKNIVIVPLPGAMVAVQDVEPPDQKEAARALGTFAGGEGPEVDFRIDHIDLRHTAFWAAFFFREVDEVEIDCSAVSAEEVRSDDAR